MIYLTYNQNSGGRSGHKLKDIMTTFILSYFIKDSICCYHPSWNNQSILKHINVLNVKDVIYNRTIVISTSKNQWGGMSYDMFKGLVQEINFYKKFYGNTLVQLENVTRIHPYMLYNWFLEKKIATNYYKTSFIPLVKSFYYGNNKPELKNIISIHVRRGDMATKLIKSGFNFNYYKTIIMHLNKFFNIPIHIYSEKTHSNDLLKLKSFRNVKLFLGDSTNMDQHMHSMITSKILFLSSSSFSTWAAYISNGDIFYEYGKMKHFYHKIPPNNFHGYNMNNLEIILKKLSNNMNEVTITPKNK